MKSDPVKNPRKGYWTGKKRGPLTPEWSAKISAGLKKLNRHQTPEEKERLRRANLGRKKTPEEIAKRLAAMKGYRASLETKKKMSEAHKRIGAPWLIGRKLPIAHKQKIGESVRKNPARPWLGKNNPHCTGEKSHFWRGGVSEVNRSFKDNFARTIEYRAWRRAVFERDGYACVICGESASGQLEADHILPFILYPELRLDVSNGRTLCKPCHRKTDTYGTKVFTYERRKGITES